MAKYIVEIPDEVPVSDELVPFDMCRPSWYWEAYKKGKADAEKEKEEIHVGDEVKITENGSRCVVWGIASGVASLIFEDCGTTRYSIDKLIKTGRHFGEVERLLEALKTK